MRKSGDLEAKDLTGVEESSLDKDALAQKANQVRAVRSALAGGGERKVLLSKGTAGTAATFTRDYHGVTRMCTVPKD